MAAVVDRSLLVEKLLLAGDEKPMLRFTTAGSVDDGKSTLIGRLLVDSRAAFEDQLEAVRKSRINRSSGDFDFSLLTDGLKAEREQGITIDVAYRYFQTPKRHFIIADTPGHEQYTRNMATGASTADAAIILIDARHGVLRQSLRHATISWLLGIRHVIVAINKMDLVGFDEAVFDRIREDFLKKTASLTGRSFHFLPLSALEGDNVTTRSERTGWYRGPALLELLESLDVDRYPGEEAFRFPVQYVVRPDLNFRGYAGQIVSGVIRRGDRIVTLPSGRESRVERIVTFDGDLEEAFAPLSVTLQLAHEIDIARGDMLAPAGALPTMSRRFEATIVWMDTAPLEPGRPLLLRHGARTLQARVTRILHRLNPETLEQEAASALALNAIGRVEVEANAALCFDPYTSNRHTGAFILIDNVSNFTAGAGMIERAADEGETRKADLRFEAEPVRPAERLTRYGHRGASILLPADEAARTALLRALFESNAHVFVATADLSTDLSRQLREQGVLVAFTAGDAHVDADLTRIAASNAEDYARMAFEELMRQGILQNRELFNEGEGI
jgi:sulfate adenylyltransferase large subunit